MQKVMPRRHDHTGKRFGKLTAIEIDESAGIPIRWFCLCDCGKRKSIKASHLVSGNVTSCASKGCIIRLGSSEREAILRTKEYRAWIRMKERCYASQSSHREKYRELNIQVCDRWKQSYSYFLVDVGRAPTPKHSLDRINTFGNYEPGNVRWATMKEQNRNKTNTTNVTIHGITKSAASWDDDMGYPKQTVYNRKRAGWSDYDAVMKPLRTKKQLT
jgi:hypothetical protein